MKTIITLNDNSPADFHAAAFALLIARKLQAKLLICYTSKALEQEHKKVWAGINQSQKTHVQFVNKLLLHQVEEVDNFEGNFTPEIEEIDISDFDITRFAEMVNKDQIYLIIKGMRQNLTKEVFEKKSDAYCTLNRVLCPLMLIPENWPLKNFERLVYIEDLRYCRISIVKYLAELAKSFQASLSIAHLSARGLPNIMEPFAQSIFSDVICSHIDYDQIYFNNIQEKDLIKTVDVLINGMHNDLLVLINHRFHFEEIIGEYLGQALPAHISVPLFIFPY